MRVDGRVLGEDAAPDRRDAQKEGCVQRRGRAGVRCLDGIVAKPAESDLGRHGCLTVTEVAGLTTAYLPWRDTS